MTEVMARYVIISHINVTERFGDQRMSERRDDVVDEEQRTDTVSMPNSADAPEDESVSGGLPDDFDTDDVHLVSVCEDEDGTLGWSVTCYCLDPDHPEDAADSGVLDRPCAVKQVCTACTGDIDSVSDTDGEGGYLAHGQYHRVESDGAGNPVVFTAVPDVCGLWAFLADGHDGWLRELYTFRGAGDYLVNTGIDTDGLVVGVGAVMVTP